MTKKIVKEMAKKAFSANCTYSIQQAIKLEFHK